MKEKGSLGMFFRILSPLLFYLLFSMIFTGLLEMAFPVLLERENAMWLLSLVNVSEILALGWLYRGELLENEALGGRMPAWKRSFGPKEILWAAAGGIFLARGFNGLIGLTPLPRLFPGYAPVAEQIYGGSLLSQAAASVITAPLVEELLMRGLVYRRIRTCLERFRPALFLGALIFGLFHGNLVQGVYAFLMGLFFIWLYESGHSLLLPVIAHGAANASSILLERTGWLGLLYETVPAYMLTTAVCLLAGFFCWSRFRLCGCK